MAAVCGVPCCDVPAFSCKATVVMPEPFPPTALPFGVKVMFGGRLLNWIPGDRNIWLCTLFVPTSTQIAFD